MKADFCRIIAQDRIPHAQLFSGSPGGVTLPLALAAITYLHCLNRKKHDACGYCRACLSMQKLTHPDCHCLFPIAGIGQSKNKESQLSSSLALWRSLIQENPYSDLQEWSQHLGEGSKTIQIGKNQVHAVQKIISQKPFESNYKAVIVWLPEHMHPVASNALLKIVEEPPSNVFFFFVTTNPHQVLPTLRSRMCSIVVPPLDNASMQQSLEEAYPTKSTSQLAEVASIVQGNFNLAKQVLNESYASYFKDFSTWIRQVYAQQLGDLVATANTFQAYSAQGQKNWVIYAIQCLRNALIMHFGAKQDQPFSKEETVFQQKFNKAVSVQITEQILVELCQLTKVLQRNANPKLAFVHSSLQIAKLFSV